MNPQIIENYELVVVGLECMTTAQTIASDMQSLSDEADRLGLESRIPNRVDLNVTMALLWDWLPDDRFPLMVAAEVTGCDELPETCLCRRFPPCGYAVFPMGGVRPNLTEPWSEIADWYSARGETFRMTIRRYYDASDTGDILVPLTGNLRPM